MRQAVCKSICYLSAILMVAGEGLAQSVNKSGDGVGTFGNIKGGSAQPRTTGRASGGDANAAPSGASNLGFGSFTNSIGSGIGSAVGGFAGGQFGTDIGNSIGSAVGSGVTGAINNGVAGAVSGVAGAAGFVDGSSEIKSTTGTFGSNTGAVVDDPNAAPDGQFDAIQGNQAECEKDPSRCPNSLLTAYDGWEKSNLAYGRTPLLFNPRFGQAKRQYPTLTQSGLQSVNLSADDEVIKSSLAAYQPIRFIQQSFAWDKGARDAHINLFATIRGIAILTLSYLDKTVAAGLATVQQQTDNDTNAQLLKQLGWSLAKIANPNREMLYTDTEEKFDACMFGFGMDHADSMGYVKHDDKFAAIYARVNVNCPACKSLSPLGEGLEGKAPGTVVGVGRYHYCVCCAETGAIANRGSVIVEDGKDVSVPGAYSLVERAFNGKWMLLTKEQMEAGK